MGNTILKVFYLFLNFASVIYFMYGRTTLLVCILMVGMLFAQDSYNFYGLKFPLDEKFADYLTFSTTKPSGNDPSSPSIKITGGSQTKIYVDAKDSFNCTTGELIISVPDGIIGGKLGLFNEAPPYLNMVTVPIDGNQSIFTIQATSVYSLVAIDFPAYVQLNEFKKTFVLCQEQTTTADQIPKEPSPVVIQNTSNVPAVPGAVTQEDAAFVIEAASLEISKASSENKEVSLAQSKLAEAKVVFSTKDYEQAKKLGQEAYTLANSAQPIPKTVTANQNIKPETKPKSVIDVVQLAIIIGVSFVLILVYLILSERKTKSNTK